MRGSTSALQVQETITKRIMSQKAAARSIPGGRRALEAGLKSTPRDKQGKFTPSALTGQEVNHLVVGMPRTSKPSDLLRLLKDLKAVDLNFPLSNIASPPPSLPRFPRAYKPFHITFPSPVHASFAYDTLNDNRMLLPPSAELTLTHSTSKQHNEGSMGSIAYEIAKKNERFLRDQGQSAGAVASGSSSASGRGQQPAVGPVGGMRAYFNRSWMNRSGVSGRVVSVSGLPYGFSSKRMTDLATDRFYELFGENIPQERFDSERSYKQRQARQIPLTERDGIMPLPSSIQCSRFGLTFKTVTDACRAARQLNMTRFTYPSGVTHVVRASVVW